MDDLVQFLHARLDDDERVARRVFGSWREIGETGVIVTSDGQHAEECANGNWTGIADHITRHDAARVLREVDAKRRIIEPYGIALKEREALRVEMRKLLGNDHDRFAKLHREESELIETATRLKPVIKLLALPYAEHPGYRDEWRPEA
ncbi:DUF6221 family protein [Streptomyces vilmorinianum]|uniref:DUF6221 family protein n=1 Tax=Streptomyces vilmorinianum TaxID=3051092 RepID=UPI0010FB489D|nr:DUF6221 family protein [Streptomyces vilmorinianum]